MRHTRGGATSRTQGGATRYTQGGATRHTQGGETSSTYGCKEVPMVGWCLSWAVQIHARTCFVHCQYTVVPYQPEQHYVWDKILEHNYTQNCV